MKTVGVFPSAIFWLSFGCVAFALVCMCLVRLPPDNAVPLAIDINANVLEGEDAEAVVPARVVPEREATLVSDAV